MSKQTRTTRTGFAVLLLLCLFANDLLARETNPEAERIYDSIRSDERSPVRADLSGSWTLNPEIRGPSHHFILEQDGTSTSIKGVGAFSGCLGTYTYTLSGSVSDALVSLIIHRNGRVDEEMTFRIVDYRGLVALARTDYDDKYPMITYKDRKNIETVLSLNGK